MDPRILYGLGLALIFAGVLVILVAVVSFFLSVARRKSGPKGASVILVGPFPIIFGTDKKTVTAVLLLSLIFLTMTIILYVAWR